VLGSGIDVPYPRENAGLMQQITKHGAVLSEFPMGTKPDASHFPRRNRIVSGMTLGTLVIESAVDGGAMITASSALDQNREVFAVPGSVFNSQSDGTHALIKEGRAKPVRSVDEILQELPGGSVDEARPVHTRQPQDLTFFERSILDTLSDLPVHVDTIAEKAAMGVPDALVALLGLEFKKLARQLPGRHFVSMES
jgi:DNA processing protein